MKHLQYFQERKPASIDVSVYATGSEDKRRNGRTLKKYGQEVIDSEASSHKQNAADRIRNYCLYILMFVHTGHAVVDKIKNCYKKNVLATKEGLEILRIIFLAGRNITPAQQQKIQSTIVAFVNNLSYGNPPDRLLTQFKTIAPDLFTKIDAVIVTSETVVSALWPYTLRLWLTL
jgi:hypothetical protein